MENVIRRLRDMRPDMGLYANHYNVQSGATVSRLVTFGATADSFYEYLLKAWIQVCACTRVHVDMSSVCSCDTGTTCVRSWLSRAEALSSSAVL